MPMERPTLPELIEQGAAEFESRLPGVLVRLRRSVIGVINRVVAGGLSALYKYAEYLDRQKWPDQADGEHLDDHGAIWRVPRNPAAHSTGTVRFTGVDGSVVPLGTTVQRADGQTYATTEEAAIAGGEALIAVQAVSAGQASSAALNTSLRLVTPVPGIVSTARAHSAISGGADVEEHERYRPRILARIRKPPHGGRKEDYEEWAKEVSGVTRVWIAPREQGPGTVVVRFMRDDDIDGAIPDAGEVAAVQAHIDAERPVTATVFVVAPIPVPLNFTIAVTPNTPAVQAAVRAELQDLIRREAKPGGTLLLSHIREAISIATGEVDYTMTAPTANVVSGTGEITTMGAITWL